VKFFSKISFLVETSPSSQRDSTLAKKGRGNQEIQSSGSSESKRKKKKKISPGGPAPTAIVGPPVLIRQPSEFPKPEQTRQRLPLAPYLSDLPLSHAAQDGWDCVLHAFRSCIRSRAPSLETFIADCTTVGFVGVGDYRKVGFPIGLLRFWLSRNMPTIVLKKKKGNFQVRKHLTPTTFERQFSTAS
jgi:hypothetical protein